MKPKLKPQTLPLGGWRFECSSVTAVKEAYRQSSPRQRQALRAFFLRVLTNMDGNR